MESLVVEKNVGNNLGLADMGPLARDVGKWGGAEVGPFAEDVGSRETREGEFFVGPNKHF